MSLSAYQQVSKRAESPSSTEYRLFAQVTQALMQAKTAPVDGFSEVAEAVDWNRRVWNAMALDCSQSENALPESMRAGIISLALFIGRHSSVVVREVNEMDTLIDINKMIMQGLADQQANAANDAATARTA